MVQRKLGSFVAGFVTAALMFGGFSAAADTLTRLIQVNYQPLNYVFNGQAKTPPTDQQGFVYNNRTFVSLRFMSEALNKEVSWDEATRTIYVGRKPSPLPAIWEPRKVEGFAPVKVEYYEKGARNLRGVEMPNSLLVSSSVLKPTELTELSSSVVTEWRLPENAKSITGTIFVPDHYFGTAEERKIGYLTFMNELNQPIYRSEVITNRHEPVAVKVPVDRVKAVSVHVVLYHNQGVQNGSLDYVSQLGIADLKAN